jgi:hypothetical protein
MPAAGALPAVAGLAELAAMVLAFITLYAIELLLTVLTLILLTVPVVGPWIRDNLTSRAIDVIRGASGWTVSAMGQALGLIWTPVTWIWALLTKIWEVAWAGAQATERIVTGTIPRALNMAAGYAQQLYNAAISFADGLYHQAVAFAQALVAQAVAYAQQLYNSAVAFAQQLYNSAVAFAQQLYAAAVGYAEQLYHQAVGYVQGAISAAEAWVQQLYNTLTAWVTGRFTQTETWVQQEVGALEHDISGAYQGAVAYAHDAAALAEAAGIAAAGTVALELERYLRECGRNLCSGLNPLSTLLQELAPLVEGGLLFALVAEAYRDPAGVANEVRAVISPVADTAAGLFRDATGVAA